MKKTLFLALVFAIVSGCATETETPAEEPVLGEAEAVTTVEEGPVDDTLVVDDVVDDVVDEELDPTYVPEEESVEGEMTEGEMLEPEAE
ncbi:MAG: hypothetical protein AAF170_09175 [Bacteroidota bacterium]